MVEGATNKQRGFSGEKGEMTDQELVTYAIEQERISIGYNTDDVTEEEKEALRRYLGYPYGDEEEGRSQVVSMDAAQVVDWALPDLLEPFVSGDLVVEFEPTKREEEKDAENATRYINHIFWKDNPGFEILYGAAKDGLVQKLGVTKILWDESERTIEQTYTGQSNLSLMVFEQDPEVEVLDVDSEPIILSLEDAAFAAAGQVPPILQAFPDGQVYTIKIEKTFKDGKLRLMGCPPEEFRISARAGTDEPPQYVSHADRKTKAQLIEMGFPEDKVRDAADLNYEYDDARDIRFYNQPHTDKQTQGVEFDWRMQKRWLLEEYLRVDVNRDGDQEIVQVFRVGNTLLSREEVACDPFACFSPFPMPHSAIGQGMVDKVRQTQRVKTVLTRQMLDNIYLANNPQTEVPEDAVTDDGATYDDLLNKKVGSLVRVKKPAMLREIGVEDRSDVALKGIEYMNQQREMDTGVVRAPIGLNADAIDKDMSATEAAQIDRNTNKVSKLTARVFAEMYLCPLMRKMLKMTQQHQKREREIQISGEWTAMDPRTWNTDMYVTTNVGLGHENRDSQAAAASVLIGFQERAAQIGMAGPMHFWQTAKDLVQALGKQFPEKYFVDPTTEAGQLQMQEFQAQQAQANQQPDAAAIRAQQDGQIKAAKLQQDGQLAQIKLQQDAALAQAKAEQDAQIELLKLQQSAVGDQAKTDADFSADMAKIQADHAAKLEQINRDTEAKLLQMQSEVELAKTRQDGEFALALRRQNLQFLASQDTARQMGGNGSGISPVRHGGAAG